MLLLDILKYFNLSVGILFIVCYAYQIFYLIVGTFLKPKEFPPTDQRKRFAFVIAARNEESVIGQLCRSVKAQNYPSELIDIYVVADNCTDATQSVASSEGAVVFERRNDKLVGKGYALEFLFDKIRDSVGLDAYDAYFVVDADNILDKNYVLEMNKCLCDGNKLAMCYRNSKNYGDNWISAGYSLWFIRASRHLNNPRQHFNVSSEITGTGFMVSKDIIIRDGGWKYHCLIEDIEFTVNNVILDEKVAFCNDAVVYDEQPTSILQSFYQRKRWSKGYIYILNHYGIKLFKRFFKGKGFSNFDMIMAISPAFLISTIATVFDIVMLILISILSLNSLPYALLSVLYILLSSYILFFFVGLLCVICEWQRIHTKTHKKILYLFTFPIFMATYIPVTLAAIFSKTEWKHIEHHASRENFDGEV